MTAQTPEFPGYRVESLIGEGGAGRVFRGVALDTEQPVAIKVFHAYRVNAPEFARRFEREVTLSRTLDHPGVVRLLGSAVSTDGKSHALVMELVEGEPLRPRLNRGALTVRFAIALCLQITEILAHMHRKGIAHLDLKPENVLLVEGSRVRLMDFGISQATFGQLAREGHKTQVIAGTPHYMAPEQFNHGAELDHRCDLFALGVILHEMIIGERPAAGVLALGERLPLEFKNELSAVLTKLLEFSPEKRYQTAVDVSEKLKVLDRLYQRLEEDRVRRESITTVKAPPPAPSPRPTARKPVVPPPPSPAAAAAWEFAKVLRANLWILVVLAFLVMLAVVYNLIAMSMT